MSISALSRLKLPSLFSKTLFFDAVARFTCLWQITALYIVGHRASVALCYGTNELNLQCFTWFASMYRDDIRPVQLANGITRPPFTLWPIRRKWNQLRPADEHSRNAAGRPSIFKRWESKDADSLQQQLWLICGVTTNGNERQVCIFRLTINLPTVCCLNLSNRLLIVFHPYFVHYNNDNNNSNNRNNINSNNSRWTTRTAITSSDCSSAKRLSRCSY